MRGRSLEVGPASDDFRLRLNLDDRGLVERIEVVGVDADTADNSETRATSAGNPTWGGDRSSSKDRVGGGRPAVDPLTLEDPLDDALGEAFTSPYAKKATRVGLILKKVSRERGTLHYL
jgi:hypothetical protein